MATYTGRTGTHKNVKWRIIHNSESWIPMVLVAGAWVRLSKEFDFLELAEHYIVTTIDKMFERRMHVKGE